jgi:hypothetical protein
MKRKGNYKTRAKSMKNRNSIDYVDDELQLAVTYVYIGNRMQLFKSDTTKSLLNETNFKPYSDSTLSEKTGHSDFQIRTLWFLRLRLLVWNSSPLAPCHLLIFFQASKHL